MVVIGLYLLFTLALPLYAMLSKSFSTYELRLGAVRGRGQRRQRLAAARRPPQELADAAERPVNFGLTPTARTPAAGRPRSSPRPSSQRSSASACAIPPPTGGLLLHDARFSEPGDGVRGRDRGPAARSWSARRSTPACRTIADYFRNPALRISIWNSLFIATLTTVITVSLAFAFAYALNRSCMPAKGAVQD